MANALKENTQQFSHSHTKRNTSAAGSGAHIGEGQFGGVAERRSNASRTLSKRARRALLDQGNSPRRKRINE